MILKRAARPPLERRRFGRRYRLPQHVAAALEQVFGVPVDAVRIVEHSLYARIHLGATATTRPNRILLTISGDEFVANPELLLHEFFHVLRQWRTGKLTRRHYLLESARCGYWHNCFEQEARDFSARELERYRRNLRQQQA